MDKGTQAQSTAQAADVLHKSPVDSRLVLPGVTRTRKFPEIDSPQFDPSVHCQAFLQVMHGGLFSEDGVTLDDIRKVDRNRQPPETGQQSSAREPHILCGHSWCLRTGWFWPGGARRPPSPAEPRAGLMGGWQSFKLLNLQSLHGLFLVGLSSVPFSSDEVGNVYQIWWSFQESCVNSSGRTLSHSVDGLPAREVLAVSSDLMWPRSSCRKTSWITLSGVTKWRTTVTKWRTMGSASLSSRHQTTGEPHFDTSSTSVGRKRVGQKNYINGAVVLWRRAAAGAQPTFGERCWQVHLCCPSRPTLIQRSVSKLFLLNKGCRTTCASDIWRSSLNDVNLISVIQWATKVPLLHWKRQIWNQTSRLTMPW